MQGHKERRVRTATKEMISEITAVKALQRAMKQDRRPRWIHREGHGIHDDLVAAGQEDLMEKKAAGGQQPEKI